MDVEKVKARAAEIDAEQKAAEQARKEEENKGFLERAGETITSAVNGAVEGVGQFASGVVSGFVDTTGDIVQGAEDTYNSIGNAMQDFREKSVNLQKAAQEAQETGDYSSLSASITDAQQSAENVQSSLSDAPKTFIRPQARSLISVTTASDNQTVREIGQDVEKSALNIEYFMTPDEKIKKAQDIELETGIPASITLTDTKAYQGALEVYDLKKAAGNLEEAWEKYPEIRNIANMDTQSAVLALHNVEDVDKTHGIVDSFMHFYERGNMELEYNNLQYKLMNGTADDNDKQRIKDLKEQLDADKTEAPHFFEDPLGAMAAQVANSLPEMGQSTGEAILVAVATAALVAGAAASETGVGAAVAMGAGNFLRTAVPRVLARQGVKKAIEMGLMSGAAIGMERPETGRRYAEMGEKTKADGTPLYTEEEKSLWAPIGGIANSVLEIVPTAKVGGNIAKNLGFFKGAPQAERVFTDAVGEITTKAAQRDKLSTIAADSAKDWLKLTATESGEEAAQSVADDTIMNLANRDKGDDAEHFNIETIAQRGMQNFVESLPGSMGFATMGLIGGTMAHGGRMFAARKREKAINDKYGKDRAQTMMGTVMVEQLQQATENAKLNKVAPEVQKKVLREQLKDTPYQTAYIDVEMAMKKDNGLKDLQSVAEKQGISGEDLQTAIEENGFLTVPVETLAQVKSENSELLDSVSFSPEAESMARMRENGKKLIEDYTKRVKQAADKQDKLADTIAENYIPNATDKQKKLLKAAITANPSNPAQGWNTIHKELREQLLEKIQPALDALEQGMGNAGIMDVKDEIGNDKTIRYSENDEWYRNFYKLNKRAPRKDELENMAIAMVTGDKSAPRVYGWTIDSAKAEQAAQENKPIIEAIQKDIADMESIKAEAKKLTGVEMELTEGLTPEGLQVYRAISDWADKAGGKVGRQGRMGAILTARNADIYADIVTRKTGQKYTAMDYLRNRLAFYANGAYLQNGTLTTQKPANLPEVQKLGQTLFQIVWHGSPYYFTAFDLSHMGEGEGNQAHGWGLYFAQNRAVSEDKYKDRLSKDNEYNIIIEDKNGTNKYTWDGFYFDANLEGALSRRITKTIEENKGKITKEEIEEQINKDKEKAEKKKQELEKDLKNAEGNNRRKRDIEADLKTNQKWMERIDKEEKELQNIKSIKAAKDENQKSTIYKVDIPENDVLIDEQAYLQDQPEKVQKALKKVCEENDIDYDELEGYGDTTGGELYERLSNELDSDKAASLALDKAGIKGITYEGGQDGRCFVIFDDKAANIVETYNQLAGQHANTANVYKLVDAQDMEAQGKSAQEIWDATGWMKGKDGKWRFEIPDYLDDIDLGKLKKEQSMELGDIYDNPKLYEAYPSLKTLKVEVVDMKDGNTGRNIVNYGQTKRIELNRKELEKRSPESMKRTLIHEIQHAIQGYEHFAMGGAVRTAEAQVRKEIDKYRYAMSGDRSYIQYLNARDDLKALNSKMATKEISIFQWTKERKELEKKQKEALDRLPKKKRRIVENWTRLEEQLQATQAPEDLYLNLAGEQEARDTAERTKKFDPEEAFERRKKDLKEFEKQAKPEDREKVEKLKKGIEKGDKRTKEESDELMEIVEKDKAIYNKVAEYYYFKKNAEEARKVKSSMPNPHNENAIIVFHGDEYAAREENAMDPIATFLQRAWHGSPYDFEAFDLGKVGAGEGAQAHGWGLYFAKDRKVSEKRYKDRVARIAEKRNRAKVEYDGIDIEAKETPDKIRDIVKRIKNFNYDWDSETFDKKKGLQEIINQDRRTLKNYTTPRDELDSIIKYGEENPKISIKKLREFAEGKGTAPLVIDHAEPANGKRRTLKDAIRALKESKEAWESRVEKVTNRLKDLEAFDTDKLIIKKDAINPKIYEVEIPGNDVLLDERKTFKEQPPKVQEALKKIIGPDKKDLANMRGKDIYKSLSKEEGGERAASILLNKAGIKGITYHGGLDGRCFVIFDDKAIDMIEKYNQQVNGSTSLMGNGVRLVEIMETADESTFMHEMAHVFLYNIEDIANIDEESQKQLDTINKWARWKAKDGAKEYRGTPWEKEFREYNRLIRKAIKDGDVLEEKRWKAVWRQERFARGFEMYLKDGKAPAKGLKAVFRQFKKFLRIIYNAFVGDGGKPSEEVRRVMNRMIASEDEIEAAALDDRYSDITKAGGEKLLTETEEQIYNRWLNEERETAKEKILKELMKDFDEQKKRDFEKAMQDERDRYTAEVEQENIYLAEAVLKEPGATKDMVQVFGFDSYEDYEKERAAVPSVKQVVDKHMDEYSKELDAQMIQLRLTPEQIDKAMEASEYREKMENLVTRGMERRKRLMNRINEKADRAIQNIEDRLEKLPNTVDFKVDHSAPDVQSLMKEINRLRFANKWGASDILRIGKMIKANTKEQVKEALEEFKNAKREAKDIKEVTKGQEEYYKRLATDATRKKPMAESCNILLIKQKIQTLNRNIKIAIKRGNWDLAVSQQKQKAFCEALIKEARKYREEREKIIKDLKRKANASSVKLPKDERYWFNHLCYILRITNEDIKKPEDGVKKLEDMFQEQIDSLDLLMAPPKLIELNAMGDKFPGFDSLSLDDFKGVAQDLTRLYVIGRDKYKLKTMGGRLIQDVQEEIQDDETGIAKNIHTVIRAINPDTGGLNYNDLLGRVSVKAARAVQKQGISNLKPENLLKMLGKSAHKYIYGTLERAAEKEAELSEYNIKELRKICSVYSNKERREWTDKKYTFNLSPDEGKISKENILCMALNYGSEKNRQRLIGGYRSLLPPGTKEEAAEMAIDSEIYTLFMKTMTEKDWNFVQNLWNHIDSFWHETAAVEEQLNGVALEKVKPKKFTITTKDGKSIELKGGYYPIKFNPEKSAKADEQANNDAVNNIMAGARRFGANRSFTKERVEYNVYRPLLLEFSVLEKHTSDVIHNIAYRIPLRDVYRLLNSKNRKAQVDLEQYVRETLGNAAFKDINDWAQDAWSVIRDGSNSADTSINKFFGGLRRNATMAIMGYHVWPCVENASNVSLALEKFGPVKTATALAEFYAAPRENQQKVRRLSMFMRERKQNIDRDTQNKTNLFHAGFKPFEVAREHAYDLMAFSDRLVSEPMWLQAYKDAYQGKLQEVTDERDANMETRIKLQEQVDQAKAKITDLLQDRQNIEDELITREHGTPDEIEAARATSKWGTLTTTQMKTEYANIKKRIKEAQKEQWGTEVEFEKSQDLPVWSDTELLDEAERRASFAADGVIRDTFGSGRAIDQTTVQRSRNELTRMLTTFYGFFATQYNAIYMAYARGKFAPKDAGASRWAPLAKSIFYRVIVMSAIGSVLQFGLGLAGDDDKDKKKKVKGPDGKETTEEVPAGERFLKVLAQNMLSVITGGIPILRDFGSIAAEVLFGGGNSYNIGEWKLGTVATRGFNDLIRFVKMVSTMGEKNAEIDAQLKKKEEDYQDKLRKAKGEKRAELIAKHEEEARYAKPKQHITYSDVLAAAARAGADFTAARTGITADPAHAIPVIMQYVNDRDARYDPTMKNIIWSVVFGKKPVEREVPDKPPAEPKPKEEKGKKKKDKRSNAND